MNGIGNVNQGKVQGLENSNKNSSKVKEKKVETTNQEVKDSYEPTNTNSVEKATYTPDLDKIKSMKAETDKRLIELFKKTVGEGFLKQVGGLRGFLDKVLSDEEFAKEQDISFTTEDIEKAKADISDDGYWGVEATSDRFIEFAKALSGGDPAKIDMLVDAFKKGYEAAKELWGGELPEISKKTYELTLEKFEKWKSEN